MAWLALLVAYGGMSMWHEWHKFRLAEMATGVRPSRSRDHRSVWTAGRPHQFQCAGLRD